MSHRDYMYSADPVTERQRLRRQAQMYAEPIRKKAQRLVGGEVRAILDLGCGAGEIALVLHQVFPEARIVGIDRDQQTLSIAQRAAEDLELGGVEYVVGDVESCLPEGPFDLVLASMLMVFTRRPERVLAHAYAALADGGRFWSRTPGAIGRDENLIYSQRLLHAVLDASEAVSSNLGIASRMGELLNAAGFTGVESDLEEYPIGGPTSRGKDLAYNIVHSAYHERPLISGVFGTSDDVIEQMYKDALVAVQRAGDAVLGTQTIINHTAQKRPV